ncbi:endonuclease Q family protein [Marinicrinis sediminis]|uniref:Endonuclease Q family protein n=1 Tax=Marinicrinis sediminis TaxID=1652465 RepID=A0ABW5RCY6_9BACL
MERLSSVFADFHIHIGSTDDGKPVKISASRNLTFAHIAREAADRKGINLIGIIDCHAPGVQRDILRLLDRGEMAEHVDGGIRYRTTTIMLGCELEVKEDGRGAAHYLVYFPYLADMQDWTAWLSRHVKNIHLSSQRVYASARQVQQEVVDRGGLFIPAHIFTPHKSLYGSCTDAMADVLNPDQVSAVELGLSADTSMASRISELDVLPFLTNSDAHSLPKIAREYNELLLKEPTFAEWKAALGGEQGRAIQANYGLLPALGKYHQTTCAACGQKLNANEPSEVCPVCGKVRKTTGVAHRIETIADRKEPDDQRRPPYKLQVPLEFIPGIGKQMLDKLLQHFGTEMNVLHHVPAEELARVCGEQLAGRIDRARSGQLDIESGGGGRYGKLK